jgi:hypothetical protein
MALQPDTQLLPNGDILAPVEEAGEWRMFRVSPEDREYAGWLAIVQAKAKAPGFFDRALRFWLTAALVCLCVGAVLFFLLLLVSVRA